MLIYVFKRIAQSVPTLLVIVFIVFSLLYITPGDPVLLIAGSSSEGISEEQRLKIEQEWGLDQSFLLRFWNFLSGAIQGDLGQSYATGQDVGSTVIAYLPATIQLTFLALLLSLLISVPLGVLSAVRPNSIWDRAASVIATVGISMPAFWVGLILMYTFSLQLGWFPSTGSINIRDAGLDGYVQRAVLPALTLALGMAATQMRVLRGSMLDVLGQDYVRFARSKGFSEIRLIVGHSLRNALIPLVTTMGTEIGGLLAGSVVIESIFSWPGVGRLMLTSIGKRDYPMIQGVTLIICVVYLIVNLLVDIAYAKVDPRIRVDNS
ncbi:ABC transporter permease [Paenarthrobacter sp. NPDC089675]|uniref:ABC transporter permease n=1 Tax=Paenarthrobacter sp. NPDC089675 TaxID=3364376 RepID=UPI003818F567